MKVYGSMFFIISALFIVDIIGGTIATFLLNLDVRFGGGAKYFDPNKRFVVENLDD